MRDRRQRAECGWCSALRGAGGRQGAGDASWWRSTVTSGMDVARLPTMRETRGALERWRRGLRRRILEPVLVGHRSFRETVLNALAARGHLVYCRMGELAFFVDPSDRAIGTELMWRGDWQRAEIERALALVAAAGRL